MEHLDDETSALRVHRLVQWTGLFAILHTVYAAWYLPALDVVQPLTLLLFTAAAICTRVRVALARSNCALSFVMQMIGAGIGLFAYLIVASIFFSFLTSWIGLTTDVSPDFWQPLVFLAGVTFGLMPLPRRLAIAMMVAGVFLPFADSAEACWHVGWAAPTVLNYAAYTAFLAGSMRLYFYAAGRYMHEGLDEDVEAPEKSPRRAVGPISDVAPIRAPASRPMSVPMPRPRQTGRGTAVPLKIQGARCPVCAVALSGSKIVRCTSCDTPHHADCFTFSEACAMYACGSQAAETLTLRVAP